VSATNVYYIAVNDANGYADAVFAVNYLTATPTADTGVFYLLGTDFTTVYKSAGVVDYYTLPALVNGVVTTVKSKVNTLVATTGLAVTGTPTLTAGNLCYATYTDGYLTAGSVYCISASGVATAINGAVGKTCFIKGTTIVAPTDGLITIGGVGYNYTASTYVFIIGEDMETVTPGLAASISSGTYTNVTAVTVAATLDTPSTATAAQANTLYAIFIQLPNA
jgi:hypothetical protein